jgi:hypothetical protein
MRVSLTRGVARILGIGALALLAAPATASATDYFVNGSTGSDANNCLSPTAGTPPSGPCQTIAGAIALAEDNTGNRVLLADGTYNESFTLLSGITLSSSDGDVDPKPAVNGQIIIGGGPTGDGSIDHLELRGTVSPIVNIEGSGTIADNLFPSTNTATVDLQVQNQALDDTVTVQRNRFEDNAMGTQFAIRKNANQGDLSILDNTIIGFQTGVLVITGKAPVIRRNLITAVHDGGLGISILGGLGAVITDNRINSPVISGTETGIAVSHTNSPASAALARNQVVGQFLTGIDVLDTDSFTLDSDLVAGAGSFGLTTFNDDGITGDATVTATNVTVFDNGAADLHTDAALLILNSALTGNVQISQGGTCSISFSRGDVPFGTPGDTTNCDDFQTAASPLFAGAGNYHLQGFSPMIDAGDPSPPLGPTDFEGDARGLSGAPVCNLQLQPGRRDIGADEAFPATGVGCPVAQPAITPAPTATTATTARRKCKKGRELKKGKCVKKKRRKKG